MSLCLRTIVRRTSAVLALSGFAAAPLVALAQPVQFFRCVGADGKRYYQQAIPPQCVGRPIEVLNQQGVVVRKIEGQKSEVERAAIEAEEKRKKEQAATAKDEERRTRALLATYTTERDIDEARIRSLAENEKVMKEIDERIAGIRKRRAELDRELEFYKGRNRPPAKLEQDLKNNDQEMAAQQSLLTAKQKEIASINLRYDDDKRRFADLTKKK